MSSTGSLLSSVTWRGRMVRPWPPVPLHIILIKLSRRAVIVSKKMGSLWAGGERSLQHDEVDALGSRVSCDQIRQHSLDDLRKLAG